jgi:hypothetical protein
MSKTFLHSGSLGDIVYSLPTIQALGGGVLYIKDALLRDGYTQFDAIAPLIRKQPYIKAVKRYPPQYDQFQYDPDIRIDYDLDKARLETGRAKIHIVKRYIDAMGVHWPSGWQQPWLTVPDLNYRHPYYLVHLTPRYRNGSRINWRQVINSIPGQVFVLGYEAEYKEVCMHAGRELPHLRTVTLLEMAKAVKGCEALICNQSVALTLAQGLGKNYWLERHPLRTNCLLYTSNEHIL